MLRRIILRFFIPFVLSKDLVKEIEKSNNYLTLPKEEKTFYVVPLGFSTALIDLNNKQARGFIYLKLV
jgi:hypothetical protein